MSFDYLVGGTSCKSTTVTCVHVYHLCTIVPPIPEEMYSTPGYLLMVQYHSLTQSDTRWEDTCFKGKIIMFQTVEKQVTYNLLIVM